ncbi:MAG: hypothetical protein MRQ07_05040 [Candidatus Midichloria sp.]|nr:hypothetical protein [Candidatus Midichloria sp.]
MSADARDGIPQSAAAAGSSKVSQSYDYKDFRPFNSPVGILIKNRGRVLDENMKLLNSLIDEELAGNQEKIIVEWLIKNGADLHIGNHLAIPR